MGVAVPALATYHNQHRQEPPHPALRGWKGTNPDKRRHVPYGSSLAVLHVRTPWHLANADRFVAIVPPVQPDCISGPHVPLYYIPRCCCLAVSHNIRLFPLGKRIPFADSANDRVYLRSLRLYPYCLLVYANLYTGVLPSFR